MQRSQRDTARRNDYAAFSANITNYITNNNGNLPADYTTWCSNTSTSAKCLNPKKYINTEGVDQSGKSYLTAIVTCDGSSAGDQCNNSQIRQGTGSSTGVMMPISQNDQAHVLLVKSAACGTNQGTVVKSSGNRDYAILGQLESGVYCQDNV